MWVFDFVIYLFRWWFGLLVFGFNVVVLLVWYSWCEFVMFGWHNAGFRCFFGFWIFDCWFFGLWFVLLALFLVVLVCVCVVFLGLVILRHLGFCLLDLGLYRRIYGLLFGLIFLLGWNTVCWIWYCSCFYFQVWDWRLFCFGFWCFAVVLVFWRFHGGVVV